MFRNYGGDDEDEDEESAENSEDDEEDMEEQVFCFFRVINHLVNLSLVFKQSF